MTIVEIILAVVLLATIVGGAYFIQKLRKGLSDLETGLNAIKAKLGL